MLVDRGPTAWIVSEILNSEAERVLEIGCGFGFLCRALARKQLLVTGVDQNPFRIAVAEKMSGDVSYRLEDAAQVTCDAEFDAVVISRVFHTQPQELRMRIFDSALRALRKRGLIILMDVSIPERPTWRAKTMQKLIHFEELAISLIDPEHYRNFKDFMNCGGVTCWIETQRGFSLRKAEFRWGCLTAISFTC